MLTEVASDLIVPIVKELFTVYAKIGKNIVDQAAIMTFAQIEPVTVGVFQVFGIEVQKMVIERDVKSHIDNAPPTWAVPI